MFFSQSTSLKKETKLESIEIAACELKLPTPKKSSESDQVVKIVFAGEMKTGKSTLVNAILENPILPSSTLPCTVVIHKLKHSARSFLRIRYKDKSITEGAISELATLTAKNGNHSEIFYVSVYSPLVPEGVEIIDTPGFNDPVPDRNALAANMMTEGDAIVFVMDGAQALKGSELPFLDQFLFKGSRKKTILCVNMVDVLNEKELLEVKQRLSKEVSNPNSPIYDQPVFYVSGKEALKLKDSNLDRQFDFARLIATIREFSKLKPMLEKHRALRYYRDAAISKKRSLETLNLSPDDQKKIIENIINRIDLVKNGVTKVLTEWKKLNDEIDGHVAQRFNDFSYEMVTTCRNVGASGPAVSEFLNEKLQIRQKDLVEQLTSEIKVLVAEKFAAEISPHIDSILSDRYSLCGGVAFSGAINSQLDERQVMFGASMLPIALSFAFGGFGIVAGALAGFLAYSSTINNQKKAVYASVEELVNGANKIIITLQEKYKASVSIALNQTSNIIEAEFIKKIESLEFEILGLSSEKMSPKEIDSNIVKLTKFISDVEKLLEEAE